MNNYIFYPVFFVSCLLGILIRKSIKIEHENKIKILGFIPLIILIVLISISKIPLIMYILTSIAGVIGGIIATTSIERKKK